MTRVIEHLRLLILYLKCSILTTHLQKVFLSPDGSYVYVNSGAIDLSAYKGTIHFAFKYIGVPALSGTYQIDNIRIGCA